MIPIMEIQPGDELLCWMRLGLAVTKAQRGNGSVYGVVPNKPQKFKSGDLTRFSAWVIQNNTTAKVLTVQVVRNSSRASVGYNKDTEPPLVTDIHYSAFKRIRKYSEISVEARQDNNTFPANFPDTRFKSFRTLTEVKLT